MFCAIVKVCQKVDYCNLQCQHVPVQNAEVFTAGKLRELKPCLCIQLSLYLQILGRVKSCEGGKYIDSCQRGAVLVGITSDKEASYNLRARAAVNSTLSSFELKIKGKRP